MPESQKIFQYVFRLYVLPLCHRGLHDRDLHEHDRGLRTLHGHDLHELKVQVVRSGCSGRL
jgi:hypothetical protein